MATVGHDNVDHRLANPRLVGRQTQLCIDYLIQHQSGGVLPIVEQMGTSNNSLI